MRIFNFLKNNSEHRKSIRVNTNIGDKYINVKLGQTYESMDILSLKIFQKDLYRLFDADYGIIVGRVLGQGIGIPNAKVSVFIPLDEEVINPITLDDIKKIEATSLYPFQTVFDKDGNGKIYNLLPRYSRNRNVNGFPDNIYGIGATPKTPVGTFPEKDEILVNETVAYVYEKYLKFTTVTNESGDYILTVPANKSYTVNMSCDITDIGRFSTCAALLKLEGYPDNYFTEDGTQINEDIPLERLPNIDIQNNAITVKPLWSQNTNNPNVGINRLDFNLIKKIKPFSTIVGNYFTQSNGTWWGDRIIFRAFYGLKNLCIGCPIGAALKSGSSFGMTLKFRVCFLNEGVTIGFSTGLEPPTEPGCNDMLFCIIIKNILPFFKIAGILVNKYCQLNGGKNDYPPFGFINLGKTGVCKIGEALSVLDGLGDDLFIESHQKGNLDLRVFNIKNSVPEEKAQILNEEAQFITNNDSIFNDYSYKSDIELYPKDKYISYQNNGSFITLINCNRNKVITNENGDLIPVDDTSEKGVFTSFRGYFYVTNDAPIDNPPNRNRTGKIALKIPQFIHYGDPNDFNSNFNKWVWKHYKFDYGKIYSVAQKNNVKNATMPTNDEGTEGGFLGGATGFDEQTNILFFGAIEEQQSGLSITYIRNNNTVSPSYKDFYNHITYLGIDDDDTVNFTNEDGDSEDIDTTVIQPVVKPADIELFKYQSETQLIKGWNMLNNNEKLIEISPGPPPVTGFNTPVEIKFRVYLVLPLNYTVPDANDKWSFWISTTTNNQKQRMIDNNTPLDGNGQTILFQIYNVGPTTQYTGTGGIVKFFDLVIPVDKVFFFYKMHELNPFSSTFGENYLLECVLSDEYDNRSYINKPIRVQNSIADITDYPQKPYT